MKYKNIVAGLFLLGLVTPGYSQVFSIGVKAGAPLNDSPAAYTGGVGSESQRWLVGPTAEVHFPFRISLEVDALYRQQRVSVFPTSVGSIGRAPYHETFNDWQFPFLAKYELSGGPLRPFVDAGLSYRHVSGGYVFSPNSAGFALGGGVTFKLLMLRVSPEIRYTRWFADSNLDNLATTIGNQADFLVGFTF